MNHDYKKLGGWLVFFLCTLVLNLRSGFINILFLVRSLDKVPANIRTLSFAMEIMSICLTIACIIVILKKQQKGSVMIRIFLLGILISNLLISLAFYTYTMQGSSAILKTFTYTTIWCIYFTLSTRVSVYFNKTKKDEELIPSEEQL